MLWFFYEIRKQNKQGIACIEYVQNLHEEQNSAI